MPLRKNIHILGSGSLIDFYLELKNSEDINSSKLGTAMLEIIDNINSFFYSTIIWGLVSSSTNLILLKNAAFPSEGIIQLEANGEKFILKHEPDKKAYQRFTKSEEYSSLWELLVKLLELMKKQECWKNAIEFKNTPNALSTNPVISNIKEEEIVNDWKLTTEKLIEKLNPNETIIYRTFTLIHIPNNEIVLEKSGKEYKNQLGSDYDQGIMQVCFSEDGERLICSTKDTQGVITYHSLKKLLEQHKGIQVVSDWKLITQESRKQANKHEFTVYYTFTLIHIPTNRIVLTLEGNIYGNSAGTEIDQGITGAYISEDGVYLKCSADYRSVGSYKLSDFLE